MGDERGTLDRLAEGIGRAFSAFEALFAPDNLPTLFIELGLDQSITVGSDAAFLQKVADASTQAVALANAVDDLVAAVEADDTAVLIEQVTKVLEAIARLAQNLDAVATDLNRVALGSPDAATIGEFALEFAERALGDALLRYLDAWHPAVAAAFCLLGLAEETPIVVNLPPVDPHFQGDDTSPLFLRRQLHLDRLAQLIQDPLAFFQTTYGWGSEGFDGRVLFRRIAEFFAEIGPLATVEDGTTDFGAADSDLPKDSPPLPPVLELFSASFLPTTDAHPPGIDGTLHVDVGEQSDITLGTFGDDFRVALQIAGAVVAGLRARLLPPAILTVTSEAKVEGEVSLALIGAASDPAVPFLVFGETVGSRLQAKGFRAGIRSGLQWDAVNERAVAEVVFEVNVIEGKLVVDTSKSDSFLQRLLPSDGLNVDFDFDLGWTAQRGFFFSGAAGLELAFALNLTLGPFHLDTVHLLIGAASDKLRLEASLDGGGTLGPIATSVERIGVNLDLRFSRGNLGLVDLHVGFKFPTGLGLSVDVAGLTGGGFLSHDEAAAQYAGMLQLTYQQFQLQAFGLIATKLPTGPGYSLIAMIDANFPPIQLVAGFTLNGVGGLFGVNRKFSKDALQAALKAHTLSGFLFTKNPVANAAQILTDLETFFPAAEGRYVFGPLLQIGWGTPTLITIDLALILELPDPVRLVLIGELAALLPEPDDVLVELHMDVLGTVDFGTDEGSLDAVLHDSRLVRYPLHGAMAFRGRWAGGDKTFLLAIGGFHPAFQPPAGFPTLDRLSISMPSGLISKLNLSGYLAVTSNTLQIGAHISMFVGVDGFGISGYLNFDTLIERRPFHFEADISGGVSLSVDGHDVMSLDLAANMSGPAPWHVAGHVHFSVLGFGLTKSFSATFGDPVLDQPLDQIDVGLALRTAFSDPRNFTASLTTNENGLVSLRTPVTSGVVLGHPSAGLKIDQRVVPLGLTITRFGSAAPLGDTLFNITTITVDDHPDPQPIAPVLYDFAPAQYLTLSDDDELSSPSFQPYPAGASLAEGALTFGRATASAATISPDITFDTWVIDTVGGQPHHFGFTAPPNGLATILRALDDSGSRRYAAAVHPVMRAPLDYIVVTTDQMAPSGFGAMTGQTYAQARSAIAGALAQNADRRGTLQIVARYEVPNG